MQKLRSEFEVPFAGGGLGGERAFCEFVAVAVNLMAAAGRDRIMCTAPPLGGRSDVVLALEGCSSRATPAVVFHQ